MRVPVATRNTFESRARLVAGIATIGMAMLLVLALDGIFAGAMRQVTTYIDETDFDVAVSQEGVKNLHMTTSFFADDDLEAALPTEGIADVDTILYTTVFLISGDEASLAYLIGYEPGERGGPWADTDPPERIEHGDIVIDEAIASKHGLEVGDTVTAGGSDYRVGGLTSDTVNVVNSIAFVRFDDFAESLGVRGTSSYAFVTVDEGYDASDVARRIDESDVLTAQTKSEFTESERRIIADMSVDLMRLMNAIAFLIGLVVVALTVHSATRSKISELGVLKATGAGTARLLRIVVAQAYLSTGLAFVASVVSALGLGLVMRVVGADVLMVVEAASVLRVGLAATLVAAAASAAPVVRVARLDPVVVFRK